MLNAPVAEFIPALARLKVGSLNVRPGGTTEVPLRLGAADNVELAAQWMQSQDGYLKELWLKLKRTGTIAAGKIVKVRIESDAAGLPSGTVLGTSVSAAADTLSADYFQWVKFSFSVHLQLAKDAVYHAVLEGDYSPSPTDHILWQSATVASGGNQEIKDGSWANVPTENFAIFAQEYDTHALAFAEPAIYTPDGGAAKEIPVVRSRHYDPSEMLDVAVNNRMLQVRCREADVSDANNKATLKIQRTVYKVTSVQPDGEGMVELMLSTE